MIMSIPRHSIFHSIVFYATHISMHLKLVERIQLRGSTIVVKNALVFVLGCCLLNCAMRICTFSEVVCVFNIFGHVPQQA